MSKSKQIKAILIGKKRRQPWSVFLSKALITTVGLVVIGLFFASSYTFGMDTQPIHSLPYRLTVVHKNDQSLKKGDYFAFRSDERMSAILPEGTLIVKEVIGVPGDHVVIKHGVVHVNDEPFGVTELAETLKHKADDYDLDKVLDEGEYWMMGTHPYSFDSRYWGPMKASQMIGRAGPVW